MKQIANRAVQTATDIILVKEEQKEAAILSVIISDEIIEASKLTNSEFLQEIALYFFQTGKLTVGYAARMADMDIVAFRALLKERNIPLYTYDVEDLEVDLKNLQELGRL